MRKGVIKKIFILFFSSFVNLRQLGTRKSMVICKGRASNTVRDGIEAFECGNILSAVNDFRLLGCDIVSIILHL